MCIHLFSHIKQSKYTRQYFILIFQWSGLTYTAKYHPRGENIPVTVAPAEVNDSVSTEDEIEKAVKKLRRNRSGGEGRQGCEPST